MLPYVIYFGSGRFAPLVTRFIAQWASVSEVPLHLLTDTITQIPPCGGVRVERHDPAIFLKDYHRPGHAGAGFDYKACLILAKCAADGLPAGCLFMDCDNLLYQCPITSLATAIDPERMAIGTDPGLRAITHPAFALPQVEESSSILYLPKETAPDLCRDYRALWRTSPEPGHELLEQRTWTLVAKNNHGQILPRQFSWSRIWGAPPADCVLKHCHGDEKWQESDALQALSYKR
jgi:hypothetical protein